MQIRPGVYRQIGGRNNTDRRKVMGSKVLRNSFRMRHYDALEAARAVLREQIDLETKLNDTKPPTS